MTILSKANTLEWFKINRPELYNHVNKMNSEKHKCKIFNAPVKSGKRGGVEISSLINDKDIHIFITALLRIADKNQFTELQSYGIKVHALNTTANKNICIKVIDEYLENGRKIIIHLDELDYGCGTQQLVNYIWTKYKNNDNVEFIIYSATPQVAMVEFLGENDHEIKPVVYKFVPPSSYYGIENYIEDGKLHHACNFIKTGDNNDGEEDEEDEKDEDEEDEKEEEEKEDDITFTSQAKKLIKELIDVANDPNDPRHVAILRLAGSMKEGEKKIQKFELMKKYQKFIQNKYKVRLKFGGSKDNNIEWDVKEFWDDLESTRPFIIVINQTSGRSTEWRCHHKVVWFHTARTECTPNSTRHQDQERPVFYKTNYEEPVNITIYGDVLCAELSSGRITDEEFKDRTTRKLDARIKRGKGTNIEVELDPKDYDTWEDIPEEYTKGKKLSTYIKEDKQLRRYLKYKDKKRVVHDVKINDSLWKKWGKFENFYMSDVRSDITKLRNGIASTRPIWHREDIENDKKAGVNEKNRVRINVIYPKDAKDYKDYKFTVRRFVKATPTIDQNISMYNNK